MFDAFDHVASARELLDSQQKTIFAVQGGIESAEQEALWIVAHAFRLPTHHVITDQDRVLSPSELAVAHGG